MREIWIWKSWELESSAIDSLVFQRLLEIGSMKMASKEGIAALIKVTDAPTLLRDSCFLKAEAPMPGCSRTLSRRSLSMSHICLGVLELDGLIAH